MQNKKTQEKNTQTDHINPILRQNRICHKIISATYRSVCYIFMWANISDRNSHCGDHYQTCLFRHDHSCSLVTLVLHGLLPLHSLVTSHYDTSNMQYPAFERCTLKHSTSKSQSQKNASRSTCFMEDHKMPAPTKMEELCSC